ncbi:hypothetical protein M5C99_03045 [Acidovorax sp. NCPPB 2350]|nr:hypothetical protein M5C99_03045 [Acidovorax sp. NCPPB 2350]
MTQTGYPLARHYTRVGAQFVAIGVDTTLLSQAAGSLLQRYRDGAPPATAEARHGY